MLKNRVCFDATDINTIVTTKSQSEIVKEIRFAKSTLAGDLAPELVFYWQDRLNAYELALAIAEWRDIALITNLEVLLLKHKVQVLQQKLYSRVTATTPVKGGIKL